MMSPIPHPSYPTPLHADVASIAHDFFYLREQVDTVLLVNSCARGVATADSDLDMAVLVAPETPAAMVQSLETSWRTAAEGSATVAAFRRSGRYAAIHLDVVTGPASPVFWDDGGGPDYFEIEIGNLIAYSAPLGQVGPYYKGLRAQWLPYYGDTLRVQRLSMARDGCMLDLDHVPFFVKRGLYYQAFDRLYKTFQEFLQALFIARRAYPIAYNKWLRDQVESWLELPQVYRCFRDILSIHNIESDDLITSARLLSGLVETWVV